MKTVWLFLMVSIVFVITNSVTVHSAEPEKFDTVIVTGVGVDADKARQNAVRNAVEQVVGVYVKSDTVVENSSLIKDEILSYSGGYVESTKIITTEQSYDGLYSVKIEARVVSTRLIRKLTDLNIATKQIDNAGLFGAALSKIDADRSRKDEAAGGNTMLEKFLQKFPKASYKFTVGELSVTSADSSQNSAKITVPVTIVWDSEFIDEFITILKKTRPEQAEFDDGISGGKKIKKKKMKSGRDGDRFVRPICFDSRANASSMSPEFCTTIEIPANDYHARNDHTNLSTFGKYCNTREALKIKVVLKDSQNKTVRVITRDLPSDSSDKQGFSTTGSSDGKLKSLRTIFNNARDYIRMPNMLQLAAGGVSYILVDGRYTVEVSDTVDVGLLKRVASMDVYVDIK